MLYMYLMRHSLAYGKSLEMQQLTEANATRLAQLFALLGWQIPLCRCSQIATLG
jgi:hypothetical protein